MSGIVVWTEIKNGEIKKPSLESITAARKIVGEEGNVFAVVIGNKATADVLASYPITSVQLIESDLTSYQSETYTESILAAVNKTESSTVVMPASALGRDLSARLAARMDATLATDVTDINTDNGLIVKRPVYSGKLIAELELLSDKKVISIRPNTFDAAEPVDSQSPVEILTPEDSDIRAIVREAVASAQDILDVTEADIIVSGGRGVAGSEGFELIEETARLLKGAVGASRAAVDEGWIPYKHQVGQTGKVVTPVLYIACGISGAIQHFAGMGSAKFIIAINTDKEAPIMQKADFAIVGDLFQVLPLLKDELAKIID